ncbi:MAG TPA: hypothetical protein VFA07_17670 [Chthonomonadaceae bacterium]|nr:hypothetical protein [Chthonomonadaceae bacterium]
MKFRSRLRKFLDDSPAALSQVIAFAVILDMLRLHVSTPFLFRLLGVYFLVSLASSIILTMLSAVLIGLLGLSKVNQSAEEDAAPVIQKTR